MKKLIKENEYIPLAALVGAPLCDKNKKKQFENLTNKITC